MADSADMIDIYTETGTKRTFAGAIDWPGWCRSGRDEAAAVQALFDYAPRYARALRRSGIEFTAPAEVSRLVIVERLPGTTTTDFGAPDAAPSADSKPVGADDLARLEAILKAAWQELDTIAQAAAGKELRLGPRGGGRSLEKIVRHVTDAEGGYLGALGWKFKPKDAGSSQDLIEQTRAAALDALRAAAHGDLPARGPRGGIYWTPRYFVRRTAWHALDHAWEIEDRAS